MIFFVNGKYTDDRHASISVLDNGLQFGDGFYDSMHAYDGVLLEVPMHLRRLRSFAKTLGITMPWPDADLTKWLKGVIRRNRKAKHLRVRVTVTRGKQGFDFTTCDKPTIIITCQRITLPAKLYSEGVRVGTMTLQRLLPAVKTVGLTSMIMAQRAGMRGRAFEMIFTAEDGTVREGASMNVFIVRKGVLITPVTEILHGFTRNRVIALAKEYGWKVLEKDFSVKDLRGADEVFLTNGLWEIIPVIAVDGKTIGTGKPGFLTKQVIKAYKAYVRENVRR